MNYRITDHTADFQSDFEGFTDNESTGNRKTGFFERVYAVVSQIPTGKVMTYGQIAHLLGDGYSARYVGYAMRAAPEGRGLPCHRVVNRKGEMAPGNTFGSPERQRSLLENEGVLFRADGKIDLPSSLFDPLD